MGKIQSIGREESSEGTTGNAVCNFMKTSLSITHVSTAGEARQLRDVGHCPVECSFGSESVVDTLQMDHHGAMAHLEGVALRAYRDHFGSRRNDPRFVVTGAADADATFAIAALAGLLPHPSRRDDMPGAPPIAREAVAHDLLPLARLVNMADIQPIGLRLEESAVGQLVLLFKRLASGVGDATAFHAGVDRWRMLTASNPPAALLHAVVEEERQRVILARSARIEIISPQVAFVESEVWGYDVWYAEVRPIIVAFDAQSRRVTIGCPDKTTAEKWFGPGGLNNIYPRLQPAGWGGRETIGGSPRGMQLDRQQALSAAKWVAKMAAWLPQDAA